MHRTIRPLAIATIAASVAVSSLAVSSFAGAGVASAANPRQPTSAPQLQQLSASDPRAFWTLERMASATPMTSFNVQRNKPRVRAASRVKRQAHVVGSIDNQTGDGGTVVNPAQVQPALNYPYPFGRRGVEKQLRKVSPYKAVGRVFFRQDGVLYSCSGSSVVGGPRHVVFTAGHCLNNGLGTAASNWSTDVVFIPGRKPGRKKNPYGKFPARELWTPLGWSADGDFSYDIGAFTVGKNRPGKKGKKLKKVVGALGFAYNKGRIQHWDIFGYPAGKPWGGNKLITCSAQHAVDDDLPGSEGPFTVGVGCDMNGGSSGGPWILQLRRGNLLNGVTSYAYKDFPDAKYSPWFDATANNLRCAAAKNDSEATAC